MVSKFTVQLNTNKMSMKKIFFAEGLFLSITFVKIKLWFIIIILFKLFICISIELQFMIWVVVHLIFPFLKSRKVSLRWEILYMYCYFFNNCLITWNKILSLVHIHVLACNPFLCIFNPRQLVLGHKTSSPLPPLSTLIIRWFFFRFCWKKHNIFYIG